MDPSFQYKRKKERHLELSKYKALFVLYEQIQLFEICARANKCNLTQVNY